MILDAQQKFEATEFGARAVSMPSHELFARQDQAYRDSVLPKGMKRIAIEAAHPMSWYRWVGDDGVISESSDLALRLLRPRSIPTLGLRRQMVETAKKLVGTK